MARACPAAGALQFGLVVVRTFAEALVALLLNGGIQTVIVVDDVIPTAPFSAYFTDLPRAPLRAAEGKGVPRCCALFLWPLIPPLCGRMKPIAVSNPFGFKTRK